ncbi:hypothetical protein EMIT07CA2_10546 [Brevibacillus sp. IT-7CA2]
MGKLGRQSIRCEQGDSVYASLFGKEVARSRGELRTSIQGGAIVTPVAHRLHVRAAQAQAEPYRGGFEQAAKAGGYSCCFFIGKGEKNDGTGSSYAIDRNKSWWNLHDYAQPTTGP